VDSRPDRDVKSPTSICSQDVALQAANRSPVWDSDDGATASAAMTWPWAAEGAAAHAWFGDLQLSRRRSTDDPSIKFGRLVRLPQMP
jgi:hypothetical protein